jgi:hypothetical protein
VTTAHVILALDVATALAFDVNNGFHDTAEGAGRRTAARRRLSQDEVAEVARRLRSGAGLPDQVDVGVGITHVTGEVPDPGDVQRVLRHLADTTHGGGPLDEGAG